MRNILSDPPSDTVCHWESSTCRVCSHTYAYIPGVCYITVEVSPHQSYQLCLSIPQCPGAAEENPSLLTYIHAHTQSTWCVWRFHALLCNPCFYLWQSTGFSFSLMEMLTSVQTWRNQQEGGADSDLMTVIKRPPYTMTDFTQRLHLSVTAAHCSSSGVQQRQQ